MLLGFTITPDQRISKKRLPGVDSVCHVSSERARICDHAASSTHRKSLSNLRRLQRPDIQVAGYEVLGDGEPCGLVVPQAGSLYNPAPAPPWTDRTTQPCEDTDFSPLTNPLAHPCPAVSHQRRHLYRPRQYFRDCASADTCLRDDRSRDGIRKRGQAELAQYIDH